MVERNETPVAEDPAGELRGTLIRRLAVAGVLVAVLLGILAFFDYLVTPPEEPELPVFTQPVPVAPRKEVSQPVTPVDEPVPTEAAQMPQPTQPAEPPPPPVAEPAPPVPAGQPAPAGAAPLRRSQPASTALPSAAQPMTPTRPQPAPVAVIAEETAPPEPLVADVRVVPPRTAEPAAPRLFSGFLLQAGVFSSAQRAEELHARLTLSGVPSTLETRVQVGPFRTRKEAEAAQARLKELGIQTILVAPPPRR